MNRTLKANILKKNTAVKSSVKRYIQTELKQNVSLKALYSSIQAELEEVENRLKFFTESSNPLISEIGSYLFQQTGKRIRPALLILCSRLLSYKGKDHILMSALVETIHTASLLHDDIIDNSDRRRGRKTVHSKWGPNITVLLGDFLYIKTLDLALKKGHQKIMHVLTETSSQMIEGELDEYSRSWNLDTKEKDYFDIIRKKTASLFSASCQIGGILGTASEEQEASLIKFGTNIGMAFQVVDDLLDYSGDEKTLGKPVLSDLSEGRITLPLIYTLNNDNKTNQKRMSSLLKHKDISPSCRQEILDIIHSNGALRYTHNKAEEFSLKAKESIQSFPPSLFRESLSLIPDFLLARKK